MTFVTIPLSYNCEVTAIHCNLGLENNAASPKCISVNSPCTVYWNQSEGGQSGAVNDPCPDFHFTFNGFGASHCRAKQSQVTVWHALLALPNAQSLIPTRTRLRPATSVHLLKLDADAEGVSEEQEEGTSS